MIPDKLKGRVEMLDMYMPAPETPPPLTEAEVKEMEELWPGYPRELAQQLYRLYAGHRTQSSAMQFLNLFTVMEIEREYQLDHPEWPAQKAKLLKQSQRAGT